MLRWRVEEPLSKMISCLSTGVGKDGKSLVNVRIDLMKYWFVSAGRPWGR